MRVKRSLLAVSSFPCATLSCNGLGWLDSWRYLVCYAAKGMRGFDDMLNSWPWVGTDMLSALVVEVYVLILGSLELEEGLNQDWGRDVGGWA
ncbi:hypothetical protein SLA2020_289140 [Shorea laevis]